MKKRYGIAVFLLCLSMLVGSCAAPVPAETEELEPVLNYGYEDLSFSLEIPEHWIGRFSVEREDNRVTVCVDGAPMYSFASVRNEKGAKVEDLRLTEDGYQYYSENGAYFFYYIIHSTLPEDLYLKDTYYFSSNYSGKAKWHTEKAMTACWQITWETELYSILLDSGTCYLSPNTPEYINYRMGIAITLPEKMLNLGSVYIEPWDDYNGRVLLLRLLEETEEQKYVPYGICAVLAMDITEPYNDFYNVALSPNLVYHDSRLCGVVNEWRRSSWRDGYEAYYGWERYPEEIRNAFTFEDVEEIVNSFRFV